MAVFTNSELEFVTDHRVARLATTDAYTNIGLAYIELSKYKKAVEHFDEVLKIDKNDSRAITGKRKATDISNR